MWNLTVASCDRPNACGGAETTILPEEAAAVAAASPRAVFRWVEASLVHFAETLDGRLYVCVNSLPPGAETQPLIEAAGADDRKPPINSSER